MHDVNIIAGWDAHYYLKKMNEFNFQNGVINKLKYLNRLRHFATYMFRFYGGLAQRNNNLRNKIPLDNLHFHYFEYDSYMKFLNTNLGKLEYEEVIVPGNGILTVNKL